jgi:spore coat polysaccharide biosynthesis predicted glycosyltransferase SpsG
MNEIYFYCSGKESGLGHLSRSRALSEALADAMSTVFHVVESSEIEDLTTNYLATGLIPKIAVIDFQSRVATEKLAFTLKAMGCVVIVIGDETMNIDVDMFICPGPHCETIDYRITKAKYYLLGPANALLNDSFCDKPWNQLETHSGTVICVGSTVDNEMLLSLAMNVLSISEHVTIVTPQLIPQLKTTHGVSQLVDVKPSEIADAYRRARVAITGCGVSSLEALAMGIPLALFSIGSIQEKVALEYSRNGVAKYLGPLSLYSIDSAMVIFRQFYSHVDLHKLANERARSMNITYGITNVRNHVMELLS